MKNIIKYILGIRIGLVLYLLHTDFLNVKPEDRFCEESVWQDPALVEAFVNEMYRGLNHGMRELMLGSLADESQFIHNYGSSQVVQSNLTPADIGSFSAAATLTSSTGQCCISHSPNQLVQGKH